MSEPEQHDITYRWAHPDFFRADCSCGWVRGDPDRDAVEADVDQHLEEEGDGIDWAEVARDDAADQAASAAALRSGGRP